MRGIRGEDREYEYHGRQGFLADPELADQVWGLWNAGDITDGVAAWAWSMVVAYAHQLPISNSTR